MLQELVKLGFSPVEAKVYLVILEEKEVSAGVVIKKTGIHRMTVYETLRNLVKKGTIGQVKRKGKLVFKIMDPEVILDEVKEKYDLAKSLAGELQKEYQKLKDTQVVEVVEGEPMIKKKREEVISSLKKDEWFYVLGSGGEGFYTSMGKEFQKAEKKRAKLGIKRKYIAYESERRFVEKYEKNNPLSEVRYLREEFLSPTSTIMGGDRISIYILGQEIIIVVIINKKITEAYRRYFDVLWKIAEK